ncbi:MAG TPA: autotransporter assembly complex family protein [Gammaproteobacteria bacterium]|nr:autotransporter assembly complex family protein [Gammaproteobacteria bacterium]
MSLFFAAVLAAGTAAADVKLNGIEGPLAANVLAHLSLDEEPCDAPRWRVEQQQQTAPLRIREALQAFGYYSPKVEPHIEFAADCWHSAFDVMPGEPVLLRTATVDIEGEAAKDPDFAGAIERDAWRTGEPLNHGIYEGLKRRWSDLALERGYADAKFVASRIDVYPDERVADVDLRFDSGPRYTFGDVDLEQDVLSDQLARSYLPFKPGDPYDGRVLTTLYVALADSGYFQTIDVRPLEANRQAHEIPVEISLTGARRKQLSYGVGYSTDTGPRFRFSRVYRRFNESGHQFGMSAQISPVMSEFSASYRIPFGDPRKEWVAFDAGIKTEDTETSTSDSFELGARRVVVRPGNWTRTQLLTLLVEDFEVGDQTGRARLLMPGIDWTRINADSNIRPKRGSKLSLRVQVGADALGSDQNLVQTVVRGKWIWSTPRMARFIVRGELGAMAEQSFQELPASMRFFAGGDNSVRGYDFEALGPRDASGQVIGGSQLATASFEYEHPVKAKWSMAAFVDAGNAFEHNEFEAKTGAGLGARWQSPLGPIRIDIAHPFDDPETSWRLHINLGPDL